jgi:hypothetical protein
MKRAQVSRKELERAAVSARDSRFVPSRDHLPGDLGIDFCVGVGVTVRG